MEIFKPAKIDGSALGSLILKKVEAALSPMERARWIFSGSIDDSPTAVEITTGKNAIRKATSTLGNRPKPNQTSSSGAIATLGIACEEISSGSTVRENDGHMKMPNASGTPIAMLAK